MNDSRITVKRQAELLGVNRTSIYRQVPCKTISAENLHIMRRIDELHTAYPTWCYRTVTRILRRDDGLKINRKKVRRMMRDMGIYTIFPKPNLSKRYHAQYVQPYLLRNLDINRVDHVWGVDITYVPMKKGFMYLFVIIDWYSRCIVDFELSTTLDKSFVMTCLKRAFRGKRPEIMNSDQGSHFTNPDYLNLLKANGIKISMDGKGQALDNVRTERVFRTIKYDCVYINEFHSPRELRIALNEYIHTYNTYRPHSSIGGLCPAQVYNGSMAA